ncbi:helix-turn-helix domain-containing protein [Dactylosporangium sp. CA-233914]|uniref:helix-turn-helix domain-containing protein n=1 Tax=Dactylosporangium sp. CA-233914 TaxID=3239934 RepID=UPI003D9037A8
MMQPPNRAAAQTPPSSRPSLTAGHDQGGRPPHRTDPVPRTVDRHTTLAPQGSQRRTDQTAEVVKRYVDRQLPIRTVAAELGLSYGKVHALLVESATPRRPVGGSRIRVQRAADLCIA